VNLIREGMAGAVSTLEIIGDDNTVSIGTGTRYGGRISVIGTRNRVEIGPACNLFGSINFLSADATLIIGRETTMVQGSIQLHEPGFIEIGEDCMISTQVYLSLSDIHPIYDKTSGERINPAASVTVGRHVWLGLRSMIMKGTSIGDGSIVAAGAIVSGDVPPDVVVAGIPARVVRLGVEWRRDFEPGPA
jgi:acetyltransferase-like isoleucine patch superfamily enzyme